MSDAALSVSVVIPAYNEAERIAATIRAAQALTSVGEVIVMDDGSTDDTGRAAASAGATVVRRARNRGKAAAMEAGADAARGDLLLFLDADLGTTACEARVLISPVLSGASDVAIATFPLSPAVAAARA